MDRYPNADADPTYAYANRYANADSTDTHLDRYSNADAHPADAHANTRALAA